MSLVSRVNKKLKPEHPSETVVMPESGERKRNLTTLVLVKNAAVKRGLLGLIGPTVVSSLFCFVLSCPCNVSWGQRQYGISLKMPRLCYKHTWMLSVNSATCGSTWPFKSHVGRTTFGILMMLRRSVCPRVFGPEFGPLIDQSGNPILRRDCSFRVRFVFASCATQLED